ncbi:hypothetical protein BV509_17265, partial [Rhodovulum sulfidophilum]
MPLARDAAASDIRAEALGPGTPGREDDTPFLGKTIPRTVFRSASLPDLPDQIPQAEDIGTV